MVKQYGESDRQVKPADALPTPAEVDRFHQSSDLDSRPEAQHHSLGANPNQASPGDHIHDGGSSALLLAGVTLNGSRGGNLALPSIISALVRLGAKDVTTP